MNLVLALGVLTPLGGRLVDIELEGACRDLVLRKIQRPPKLHIGFRVYGTLAGTSWRRDREDSFRGLGLRCKHAFPGRALDLALFSSCMRELPKVRAFPTNLKPLHLKS